MTVHDPDPFELLRRVLDEVCDDGITSTTLDQIEAAAQRTGPDLLLKLLGDIHNEATSELGVSGEVMNRAQTMWSFHERNNRRLGQKEKNHG